jgi:hypothetical protein
MSSHGADSRFVWANVHFKKRGQNILRVRFYCFLNLQRPIQSFTETMRAESTLLHLPVVIGGHVKFQNSWFRMQIWFRGPQLPTRPTHLTNVSMNGLGTE